MKLVIVSGLPKSGKTSVINNIKNHDSWLHVCREKFTGESLDRWNNSITVLYEAIYSDLDIIFDSCGVNFEQLEKPILVAKFKGYTILHVTITRDPEQCAEYIDRKIIAQYEDRLASAQPRFINISDKSITIDNVDIGVSADTLCKWMNDEVQKSK